MTDARKYPKLYAMHARIQQIEKEISEPYRYAVTIAQDELRRVRRALTDMESAIRSKMIEHVLRDISHRVSEAVYVEIQKALVEAIKLEKRPSHIQIPISTHDIAWLDQKSIENRALDIWKTYTAPNMSVRVYSDGVTTIDISLPKMSYQHAMYESSPFYIDNGVK